MPHRAVTVAIGFWRSVRAAWEWWTSELWSLVPSGWQAALAADPHPVSLLVSENSFAVTIPSLGLRTSGRELVVVEGGWDAAKAAVARERRKWGPLLTIRLDLPKNSCLVRRKRLPKAALGHASALLALDLEGSTPFSLRDVYTHYWVPGTAHNSSAEIEVEHIVVKRNLVAHLLRDLRSTGLSPHELGVRTEDGTRLPVNLLPLSEQAPNRLKSNIDRVLIIAAFTTALLLVAASSAAIWRQESLLSTLQADTNALRTKALAVRKQLTELDTAVRSVERHRLRKIDSVLVIQVWEEVTQRLPDTTWLTDLRIDEGTVLLDGYSKAASELIGILSRSSIFRSVEFASPVTRDSQQSVERFQIRMKLAHRDDKSTTARPPMADKP